MEYPKPNMRQLIDWRAALLAGICSGLISQLSNILLSWWLLDSPWIITRIVASLALGEQVLPPPDQFEWGILLAGLAVHLSLSILFACVVAIVVHRWGILVSFVGGALLGLAFYAINFYTMSYFFPWFYAFRSWIFIIAHILYGALAGSIYELLEVEVYVPVEDEKRRKDE